MAGSSTITLTRKLSRLFSMKVSQSTAWPWAAHPSTGDSLGCSIMPATLAGISATPARARQWKSFIHRLQNKPDMNTLWPMCRVETIALLLTTRWKYARHAKDSTSRLVRATTRPPQCIFQRTDRTELAIDKRAHDHYLSGS